MRPSEKLEGVARVLSRLEGLAGMLVAYAREDRAHGRSERAAALEEVAGSIADAIEGRACTMATGAYVTAPRLATADGSTISYEDAILGARVAL